MITNVVGVKFYNEEYGINRQDIIKKLSGHEKIFIRREPKNKFDKNAVAVYLAGEDPKKIGYIKAELAGMLAEYWKHYKFFASIKEIRTGDELSGKPWGISIEIKRMSREKWEKIRDEKKAKYRKSAYQGKKS